MTAPSYENLRSDLLAALADEVIGSKEYLAIVQQLTVLNQAEASQKTPEIPEPKGTKAWLEKHSDALIRVGGTFGAITLIGFVESKFDVIFRSKASKYL